jgi:DNA-binding IclR family transcriptional regulator
MSSVLERTLGILECLASQPEGLPLGRIADKLNMPASAAHRLLADLTRQGYVRQNRDQGDYLLTTKLVTMVLDFMGAAGIVDFAQPVLERLAQTTGDFIRLAVVDGDRLVWVARAQGARRGLRYDPDNDTTVQLSCTASGQAWLMTMSDEEALRLVIKQGFGAPEHFGPDAPTTAQRLLKLLAEARKRGFGMTVNMFGAGLASIAVPLRRPGEAPVGVLSIAGPAVRLTPARMAEQLPMLQAAAREIVLASVTSPLFASRRVESEVSKDLAPNQQVGRSTKVAGA